VVWCAGVVAVRIVVNLDIIECYRCISIIMLYY
jgi:hypothetical protein